jgi:tRNA threonylcarbamoyladenosine biosynthesis protein TsaB
MWILGIESATLQGSVALARGGSVVDQLTLQQGMVHGRDLIPAIRSLCDRHSLAIRDLDAIAVDIGPGSYTGLRVGLATAKALSRFGGPQLLGVCSLDAMADAYATAHPELGRDRTTLCPALDAKWNQIYYAFHRPEGGGARRLKGPFADPPSSVQRLDPPPTIFGDALLSFPKELAATGATLDSDPAHLRPVAARVALRGALDYASGRRDTVLGLEPLYLRPTEAELKGKQGGG